MQVPLNGQDLTDLYGLTTAECIAHIPKWISYIKKIERDKEDW